MSHDPEWLRKAIADGSAVVKGVDPSAFGPVLDRALGDGVTEVFRQSIRKNLPEKIFQDFVIEFAQALGWRVAHFRTVKALRENGSVQYLTPVQADGEGFPDLEFVRERIVKAELKSDSGTIRDSQKLWAAAYMHAGVEYHLWRPRDVEEIITVLTRYAPCGSPSSAPQ